MKHIKIERAIPAYPIGSNMFQVKRIINMYIDAFLLLDFPVNTNFNIWCRGSSGAILAAGFSMNPRLDKYFFNICHVKKGGENAHSSPVECAVGDITNIVIDDFVQTGETINSITEFMITCNYTPDILIVSFGFECVKYQFETIISH